MAPIKDILKSSLPSPFISFLPSSYDFARRLPEYPSAAFHPWWRSSSRQINQLKDIHRRERCFLIGNGPSLRMGAVFIEVRPSKPCRTR